MKRTAQRIITDYRARGYDNSRIRALANGRPEPMRSDILKLLGKDEAMPKEQPQPTISMEDVASRANVTEVEYADGAVKIKYQIAMDGSNGHEASVKYYEAPTPDFVKALDHLHRYAAKVMDWNDEILGLWARTVKVIGFGITYRNGRRFARFAMRKKLDSGSIAEIKTPWMLVASSNEKEPQLGNAGSDCIDNMLAQAREFIGGARAQGKLF